MHSTVRNPESQSMNRVLGTKSSQSAITNIPHEIQCGASDFHHGHSASQIEDALGQLLGNTLFRVI